MVPSMHDAGYGSDSDNEIPPESFMTGGEPAAAPAAGKAAELAGSVDLTLLASAPAWDLSKLLMDHSAGSMENVPEISAADMESLRRQCSSAPAVLTELDLETLKKQLASADLGSLMKNSSASPALKAADAVAGSKWMDQLGLLEGQQTGQQMEQAPTAEVTSAEPRPISARPEHTHKGAAPAEAAPAAKQPKQQKQKQAKAQQQQRPLPPTIGAADFGMGPSGMFGTPGTAGLQTSEAWAAPLQGGPNAALWGGMPLAGAAGGAPGGGFNGFMGGNPQMMANPGFDYQQQQQMAYPGYAAPMMGMASRPMGGVNAAAAAAAAQFGGVGGLGGGVPQMGAGAEYHMRQQRGIPQQQQQQAVFQQGGPQAVGGKGGARGGVQQGAVVGGGAAGAGGPGQGRRPRTEATRVRPCAHNQWERISKKKHSISLRCRICRACWKTRLEFFSKCAEFYAGSCELGDQCPHPHIYSKAAEKHQLLKKQQAEDGEGSEEDASDADN